MLDLQLFAERLKSARTDNGISQNELAKAIGVAPGTISTYENPNGGNRYPAFDKAVAIAEHLGVSLDWLCGLSVQESSEQTAVSLLGDLINIITEFGLCVDIKYNISCENCAEIGSVNPNFIDFITEFKKILPILEDDKMPDYLKNGLKTTLLEKYKGFKIENFIQLCTKI